MLTRAQIRLTKQDYGLIFLFVIVMSVVALPILTYPPGPDQGEFGTTAQAILDGKTVYTDIWNPKPPAIFYAYAVPIYLFGQTPAAIRSLDLMAFPLMALGIYWLGFKLASRPVALLAMIGFGSYYFIIGYWDLSQNDGIAIVPMVYCLICMYQALQSKSRTWLWAIGAGLLAGLTFWFKYPFALIVLGMAAGTLPLHQSRAQLLKNSAGIVVGGLLALGSGALALESQHALGGLIESAQVTSGYTRQSYSLEAFRESPVWKHTLTTRWTQWKLPFILMLVAISFQWRKRAWLPVWGWWFGALGAMLMQAKGYGYHWLPMLPPTLLIAAFAWTESIQWLINQAHSRLATPRLTKRKLLAVNMVLCLILIIHMAGTLWPPSLPYIQDKETQLEYYRGFLGGDYSAAESFRVATFLQRRTSPEASIYIYGFRADVYYMSQRRPASRFIYNFPTIGAWYPPEWRQENVEMLQQEMPPYVFILQGDFKPFLTGRDADSNTLLQEDVELNYWLIANYDHLRMIGNFLVWRRKDLAPATE